MSSKRENPFSDYQNEEDPLPLVTHPNAHRYENGTIPEGTFLADSSRKDYRFSQMRDVGAKSVVFENCDFSYSVMIRTYFRNAKFLNCKFIGCYFIQCNFRGAEFRKCDFSYSWLSETQISHSCIFNQLPLYPNVRRVLAQTLRKNAESLGNTDAVLECFQYEMEQTRDYLRAALRAHEEYYQDKYSGPLKRLRFGLKFLNHEVSRLTWGHGESPLSVIRFAAIIWLFLASLIAVFGSGAGGPEWTTSPLSAITFGLKHSIFLMLSDPVEGFEPTDFCTFALKGIASLSGYTVFGLMVATIVRKYVRR